MEEAVDRFLYWDEEVTIIEAVTSVSWSCDVIKSCDLSHNNIFFTVNRVL